MASIESKLFYLLLRLINKKRFLEMQFAFGNFDFYNSSVPPKSIERFCKVDRQMYKGKNVFVLKSKNAVSHSHIFYLHGGAYVQNFVRQHWKFLSNLVDSTHATVVAPDYPLAPKHSFLDAFNMVVPLYREMIARVGSSNVIVMGDSAGGGFALALCQKLLDEGVPQPKRIILLSPWLDLTLSNPDIRSIDRNDPFLGVAGLRRAAIAYAGGHDLNDYMLSPINGPLDGLGMITIFIGTNDVFVADARRLKILAGQKGISIDYREYKEMVHVWMLLSFRESREAQEEIKQLLV